MTWRSMYDDGTYCQCIEHKWTEPKPPCPLCGTNEEVSEVDHWGCPTESFVCWNHPAYDVVFDVEEAREAQAALANAIDA